VAVVVAGDTGRDRAGRAGRVDLLGDGVRHIVVGGGVGDPGRVDLLHLPTQHVQRGGDGAAGLVGRGGGRPVEAVAVGRQLPAGPGEGGTLVCGLSRWP